MFISHYCTLRANSGVYDSNSDENNNVHYFAPVVILIRLTSAEKMTFHAVTGSGIAFPLNPKNINFGRL